MRFTETPRSRLEQELLVGALERAVSGVDPGELAGKRVTMNLFTLAKDDAPFVEEYLRVWLERNGIRVVQPPERADTRLEVFANVLAVDRTQHLFGTPAFSLLGVPVPALVLYRQISSLGHVELEVHLFDALTGEPWAERSPRIGTSEYIEYTALFVFGWKSTDLRERQ